MKKIMKMLFAMLLITNTISHARKVERPPQFRQSQPSQARPTPRHYRSRFGETMRSLGITMQQLLQANTIQSFRVLLQNASLRFPERENTLQNATQIGQALEEIQQTPSWYANIVKNSLLQGRLFFNFLGNLQPYATNAQRNATRILQEFAQPYIAH